MSGRCWSLRGPSGHDESLGSGGGGEIAPRVRVGGPAMGDRRDTREGEALDEWWCLRRSGYGDAVLQARVSEGDCRGGVVVVGPSDDGKRRGVLKGHG